MSPTKSSRGVPKQIGKNTLLVAQEITFAKILSGNDPKIRERGIKRLQKWLTARSSSSCQFQESDLKRIWKGLFYCMWMSDKPLVQEEIAEHISNLVHCFKNTKSCICFVKCFFTVMAVEWRGLDNWRMDKFLMFVRRFLRQVFVYLGQRRFPLKMVIELGSVINSTVLPDHNALSENLHPPLGFSLHFVDIYMDELTKVSKGQLSDDDILVALLRPFAVYMSEAPEQAIAKQIVSQIFDRLIEQSEEGHQFREKFEAWKQLGFPRGSIDAVERIRTGDSDEEMEEDEEEMQAEERELDPRAGGVSVELPVANFNPEAVVNLLQEYRHAKTSTSWSRKVVARVIARFSAMTRGKYPLGIKKVDKVPKINFKKMAEKSAKELIDFQDRITYEDDDEWMESLKRKNKAPKRSTNSDDDDSEEMDDDEEEGSGGSDEDLDDEEVDDELDEDDFDENDLDSDDLDEDDVEGVDSDDLDEDDDEEGVDSDEDGSSELDGDDDVDIKEGQNGDAEDDEEDPESEEDIEDTLNVDVEDDGEEEETEEEEVEREMEQVTLSGKKKMQVLEETPQQKTPKHLPKVIPFESSSKKQKNKQASEKSSPKQETPLATTRKEALRITPLKGTPKNTPVKGTPKNTPVKGTPKNTPVKGTPKNTPVKGTPKNTPVKGTPKNTPVKGTPNNNPVEGTPQTPLSTPSKGKQKKSPKKETPKNMPEIISNGISMKQSKEQESTPAKKEETVIVVGRKRKLSDAIATPVIQRGKQFKNVQHSPRTPQTPGSAKKVQFILQRNTAQATSEYDRVLRENPGNPYDSAKKPRFSVLKTTPLASPVNPFYKP